MRKRASRLRGRELAAAGRAALAARLRAASAAGEPSVPPVGVLDAPFACDLGVSLAVERRAPPA